MKQKVNLFVQLVDNIPYDDNYLDTSKVHHWRIHVNAVNDSSYWVVCGHDPKEALDRFLSFSNYEVNDLYIL